MVRGQAAQTQGFLPLRSEEFHAPDGTAGVEAWESPENDRGSSLCRTVLDSTRRRCAFKYDVDYSRGDWHSCAPGQQISEFPVSDVSVRSLSVLSSSDVSRCCSRELIL